PLASCSRFINSSGPVLLDPTVSSLIISEPNSASIQDCLLSCWSRRCAAVSLLQANRVCQLLFVEDASRTAGPPGSHAWGSLGSEAGAEVWKAVDIDSVIESRRLNITQEFSNSSSGRNGSIQQLTVELTGCYRIEARGAAGGSNSFAGTAGGSGASMSGRFNLTAGVRLSIVVGQAGGPAVDRNCGAGGGGGSFVFVGGVGGRLLVAAGGGGGASLSRSGK
uniref:Apple domain-containing protein n=1 Tax=Macrostomum lignano TaxID=282301 RepID=A0A1I8GEX5_9PLAT